FALESRRGPEAGQRHLAHLLSARLEYLNDAVSVLHVARDDASADVRGRLQRRLTRRNDGAPALRLRARRVHRDDARIRRVLGGVEVEIVTARTDERIVRIPFSEKLARLRVRLAELDDIHAVDEVTVVKRDDEILPVFSDGPLRDARWMIRDLVNEPIL